MKIINTFKVIPSLEEMVQHPDYGNLLYGKNVFSARIFFGVQGDSLGQVTRCHNWIILHGLAWKFNGMMVVWDIHEYIIGYDIPYGNLA